jgi:hypothetical protein
MSAEAGFSPAWLSLREGADADARAADLLDPLAEHLRGPAGQRRDGQRRDGPGDGSPLVIHDLGCGTGSMGRWLSGRLPGPQHWIMYDRDPALLEHAVATMTATSADGAPVTVEARRRDITALTADQLRGASLVTASALLDLLTAEEVAGLAAACVGAGCPALLTLSVAGRVEVTPADPLDPELTAAFNAHQRRNVDGRLLLGPDAADATAQAFRRLGATVRLRPAAWQLDAGRAALAGEWLRGWVAAAVAQEPELAAAASDYLRRRLAAAEAGGLRVVVHHDDLLAVPPEGLPQPPEGPAGPAEGPAVPSAG